MTRVEGENTRLRHPERSIASQNAMLFQISTNAEILDSIVTSLSQIWGCSSSGMIHTAIMQRPTTNIL